jgi:hypothetical protein
VTVDDWVYLALCFGWALIAVAIVTTLWLAAMLIWDAIGKWRESRSR